MTSGLLLLAAVWALYFLVHSVLASLAVKRFVAGRWPEYMPYYRLLFNISALLLLIPPLYLTFSDSSVPVWAWSGKMALVANGLALLAVAGFYYSLRYYDGAEFLGMRQIREREKRVEDQERFHISPLHRYVRHPWYSLGLVLIWTRDMPPAMLLTSILVTLYFFLGSRLEERKLVSYHGDVYREYLKRVPPIVPLPWRYLDKENAARLEKFSNERG